MRSGSQHGTKLCAEVGYTTQSSMLFTNSPLPRRLGMNKGRLSSFVRLSYLAPEIVGALLAGRHLIELKRPGLATEE
jgi:hypothetical protein